MINYTDRFQRGAGTDFNNVPGIHTPSATQEGEVTVNSILNICLVKLSNEDTEKLIQELLCRTSKTDYYPLQKEEGEDIRKELSDWDRYPLLGFAPGNYQCKCSQCEKVFMGDKRAVQCDPCALRCIIHAVEEGAEQWKADYENLKHSLSTLPSTAENKNAEKFADEILQLLDDATSVSNVLMFIKRACYRYKKELSENKPSGIDNEEEPCNCPMCEFCRNKKAFSTSEENNTSVTKGKVSDRFVLSCLIDDMESLFQKVFIPNWAKDKLAIAKKHLLIPPSEPSTIPVVDYEKEAEELFEKNCLGIMGSYFIDRDAFIEIYKAARQMSSHSDTNCKVKELIVYIENMLFLTEESKSTAEEIKEKANSLIQQDKPET